MSQAGPASPLVPVTPHETEFFLIAERGILEPQAVLLCKSIRRFAGAYAKSAISVVSPRRNVRPCRTTVRQLAALDVDYVELDLPSPCPAYGTSFKVLAAARMEDRGRAPVLVQLDSDTLFVREPDFSLPAAHVGARPVDVKGMCTEGPGDAFDPYWRALCELCDVDYESLPWVVTSVSGKKVRANYNGGLIAARRACGIFQQTCEFFLRLVAAGRKPWANSGLLVNRHAANGGGIHFFGAEHLDEAGLRKLRAISPIEAVHKGMAPFLCIHGSKDDQVAYEQSPEMCDAMRKVGAACELITIGGGGHGMRGWRAQEMQHWKPEMVAWLKKTLHVE